MRDATDSKPPDEGTEQRCRALVESGDLEGAATAFMERYGGDILAFLAMRLRDQAAASEVFAEFNLDFWRGLESFEWRTTLRGWGYTLARNAANRFHQKRRREARLIHPDGSPDCAAEERRASTAPYLRTAVKKRMRELRERLPTDDQSLLVLRIDKGLSWNELAAVFSAGAAADEAEILRLAARLRQRFASIKRRLRDLAEEEGLV